MFVISLLSVSAVALLVPPPSLVADGLKAGSLVADSETLLKNIPNSIVDGIVSQDASFLKATEHVHLASTAAAQNQIVKKGDLEVMQSIATKHSIDGSGSAKVVSSDSIKEKSVVTASSLDTSLSSDRHKQVVKLSCARLSKRAVSDAVLTKTTTCSALEGGTINIRNKYEGETIKQICKYFGLSTVLVFSATSPTNLERKPESYYPRDTYTCEHMVELNTFERGFRAELRYLYNSLETSYPHLAQAVCDSYVKYVYRRNASTNH